MPPSLLRFLILCASVWALPMTSLAQDRLDPIRLELPDLLWRETQAARPKRVALIVAANDAQDNRLDLKAALPGARRLQQLLGDLDFDEVRLLQGAQVKKNRITDELSELTSDLRGPGNQLLIAWLGHGWVLDGGQQLVTYPSQWVDQRPTDTLAYQDLVQLANGHRDRLRQSGGELTTAFWIDACRIQIQGIGGGTLTFRRERADLQLFGAGAGKSAFVDSDANMPRFTLEMCKAIESMARLGGSAVSLQPVDLRRAFDRARNQSKALESQEPTWIGLEHFLLYDPASLSLTVRAIDAETGEPLPKATLTLQDIRKDSPLATFDGLLPSSEGYFLDARAPGYFGTSRIVELERVETGLALDVPLVPAFSLVEGTIQVEDSPGTVLAITLEGLPKPAEPAIVTGRGAYRLEAPNGVDSCRLVVRYGEKQLHEETLRLATLTAPRRVGEVDIPVFVRDPLRLRLAGATEVGNGAYEESVGPINVRFDFDSLQRSDFLTGWRLYERVERYSRRKDYQAAQAELDNIGTDENLVPAARERFADLRRELRLAQTLQKVTDIQDQAREARGAGRGREARGLMDQAIDLLPADMIGSNEEARELVTSWLLVSAENWHSFGDFPQALNQLARLEGLNYDATSLSQQRSRIGQDWLAATYDSALVSGAWDEPRRILERTATLGLDVATRDEWSQRIEREAISSTCRQAFEEGKRHQAAGERQEAVAAYVKALDDAAINDHYRHQILTLVSTVEDELYRQYESIGFEKETEDPEAAVAAYLRVVSIEPDLANSIERLLQRHPELATSASLQNSIQAFRARAPWRDEVLAARRALARGEHLEALDRIQSAPDPVDEARRSLLRARIVAVASAGVRARLDARAATLRERDRLLARFEQELQSKQFDQARASLRSLRGNATVDSARLPDMERRLERGDALSTARREIAAGRLPGAEAAYERAKDAGASRAELRELDKLMKPLFAEARREWQQQQQRTQAALLDRGQYTKLQEADVRALANWLAQQSPAAKLLKAFTFDRVESFSAGGQSHWMSVWAHAQTGLEFVLVPGGTFYMGSDLGEDYEKPIHDVKLKPFLIARTECTQAVWTKLARGQGGLDPLPFHFGGKPDFPAENMSWTDAEAWCKAGGLQLPTEAQWEYACRAGTTTVFGFGSELSQRQARFDQGSDGPVAVGKYPANAFGLQDMHGNVWEWCRDGYLGYSEPVKEGSGERIGTSEHRLFRGGGFGNAANYARSAIRNGRAPSNRGRYLGLRPALDLPF